MFSVFLLSAVVHTLFCNIDKITTNILVGIDNDHDFLFPFVLSACGLHTLYSV